MTGSRLGQVARQAPEGAARYASPLTTIKRQSVKALGKKARLTVYLSETARVRLAALKSLLRGVKIPEMTAAGEQQRSVSESTIVERALLALTDEDALALFGTEEDAP
jgi:hypothetical protein